MPRFTTCSFYPYTISDNADIVLMFRSKKDSKNSPYYADFGTSIKEKDVNILFAVARSYIHKTAGLCLASEVDCMSNYVEIEKKVREFNFKADEILSNKKA